MLKISCLISVTLILISCKEQNQKQADNFFYAAVDRQKSSAQEIDSNIIRQCITDYTNAIKLSPKFWEAYRNRGGLYNEEKQFDKAIADLTISLKYADENSATNIHDMRAYAYYGLKEYVKAIEDWTIAVDELADPGIVLLQRAKAKWLNGQKESACEDYKKAIQIHKSLEKNKEFIKCE